MQKSLDRSDLLINSVIAVDHLSSFVYVEVAKEFHVKRAIKGLNTVIHSTKLMLVPQKEMPSVVSVEGKAIDVRKDSWVRMKIGICKGDLGKVVDVDNVCRQVTVQLIPRIDLQALAEKLNGSDVNKKYIVPRPRLFNFEARYMYMLTLLCHALYTLEMPCKIVDTSFVTSSFQMTCPLV